jgi:regulator of sigma E protease
MVDDGTVTLELEGGDGRQRSALLEVGSDRARLTEPGMLFEGLGFQPWQPPAVVGTVEEQSAAGKAGILEGDRIVAIDDIPIVSFTDLQRVVSARPGETVRVGLIRNGEERLLDVELGSREIEGQLAGFMGIGVDPAVGDYWYVRKFGPIAAIGASMKRTWNSTGFTIRMLARMVTGDVSIKNISGPINIAQYAGDSAVAGLNAFLTFLALVSISLGVLNLLPVPILDGGQIVYQTVELIKGSPLSDRSQLVGQQVGILALLLLMSFAFYNDIARILNQ